MKHYVLILVEIPPHESGQETRSESGFWLRLEKLRKLSENGCKIGASSWLLDQQNDLIVLSQIVAAAEEFQLKHREWHLAEEKQE